MPIVKLDGEVENELFSFFNQNDLLSVARYSDQQISYL